MLRRKFVVQGSLYVEQLHPKEEQYAAWKPHTARGFNNKADLLKFVSWPKGTPTGDAFREWLSPPADVPEEVDPTKDTKTII
jgi:hypothetical protein